MMQGSVTRRTFARQALAGGLGLTVLGTAACGSQKSSGSGSGKGAGGTLYSGALAVTLYTSFADELPLVLAFANGYFDDARLDLKVTNFASGADAVRAIATGTHLGTSGVYTALGAYAAGLKSLRMVGALQRENSLVFMVKPDSPITSVAQLKGKKLGLVGGTSSTNYGAGAMLKAAGLSLDDVTQVSTKAASDALTALENGVIDCGWGQPPLSTRAVLKKQARVLWAASDNLPPLTNSGLFADAKFAEEHRDVVQAFVGAVKRGQDAIHADPAAAAKAYAKTSGVEPDVAAAVIKSMAPGFDIGLDRAGIENNIRAAETVGLYKPGSVTYDEFVDARFT
jgi:ABC-type nitrate/sulfonate/bicarbonate transport system substrate-binding protein